MARVLLVDAEQHAVALALQVREPLEVGHGDHLAGDRRDLGDLIGHEIMMRHRHQRMIDADHGADAPRPQTRRVHDVLGRDLALLGRHEPLAVGQRRERQDAIVFDHLGAARAGGDRVRAGGAARIEGSLQGVIERAEHSGRIDDRDELDGLLGGQEAGVGVLTAQPRELGLQPPPPLGGARELHAAAHVQPDALPALLFDLGVEPDRVLLERGDACVAVHRVEPAGRVPGGAGGELFALEQRGVGAAAQREVIQDAAADDAAADHDDLIPVFHAKALLSRGDGCDGVYPRSIAAM